jgi:hypothetical protein
MFNFYYIVKVRKINKKVKSFPKYFFNIFIYTFGGYMKTFFTKALVYSIGTIVVSAAVFSITMAGLNLAGQTDITKQVIEEMDDVLGI